MSEQIPSMHRFPLQDSPSNHCFWVLPSKIGTSVQTTVDAKSPLQPISPLKLICNRKDQGLSDGASKASDRLLGRCCSHIITGLVDIGFELGCSGLHVNYCQDAGESE